MKNDYNSNSIQSLGILGGVREKPASIGLENHKHTFIEILANSIDEHREGFGDKIVVTRYEDYSISIEDFGRSVPMGKNDKGEHAYKKVFSELWSGAKYNNNKILEEKGNYLYSLGTNGCGATGTNYTSDFFEVTAYAPKGDKYYIKYEKGIQTIDLIETRHDRESTGTLIHWLPSKEVFRGSYVIDEKFINEILEQQAIINNGLLFVFIDRVTNTKKEYLYNNGIKEFIEKIGEDKNFTEILTFRVEDVIHEILEEKEEYTSDRYEYDYKLKAEVHIAFNNDVNLIDFYHNSSRLIHGGTPEVVIKNTLTYAIDKYIRNKGLYNKNESKIKFDDIKDSLISISNTFSTISLYSDQTKKCIESKGMQKYLIDFLKQKLEVYFIENPLEAEKIANQVLINKRANDKADKSRKEIKRKLQEKITIGNKINGLINCKSKDKTKNILCICEGKSALSAMISGRQDVHALFPLRGKILNCLKAPLEKILANEIVFNLIKALGCGIEVKGNKKDLNNFDIGNLNYSKIFIYVDADLDGIGSILPLLLTVFWKLTPTLVKEGRIYICETPKYEIAINDDSYLYAIDDIELEKIQKELGNKKYSIHYIKGLSELSAEAMAMCLRPEYKNITQINLNNIEESINILELFMGNNIKDRKEFILGNF